MSREIRTVDVDMLARVEGEGGLSVRLRGAEVEEIKFRVFEPPRFFEAFLRGRSRLEVPDITARICGICPVAYQMSSCRAIENAAGVRVEGSLARLRRLLYCGEWIESHGLSVFLLHAPDFLGYESGLAMARDHRELVQRGLRIKKAGNALVTMLGGRAIHPVNVRIGGFYSTPPRREVLGLLPEIEWSLGALEEVVDWVSAFDFPEFERDYDFVALKHPEEYPMAEGRIASSRGLDIDVCNYDEHFHEEQVAHSTALHSRARDDHAYFCGPLARFNLNYDRLGDRAKAAAERVGLAIPCRNPFKSIVVRAVEMLQAADEAKRLIDEYTAPDAPYVEVPAGAATGYGATEAPRGLLYHRYVMDAEGTILDAKIVPPTSQNQPSIEADLRELAPTLAGLPQKQAVQRAEHAVRNYDPCISCSTHLVDLRVGP